MGLVGAHNTLVFAEVHLTKILDVTVVRLSEAVCLWCVLQRLEVLSRKLWAFRAVSRARARLLLV